MRRLRVLPLRPFFPEDLRFLRSRLSRGVELLEPASFAPEALAAEAGLGVDVLLGGAVSEPILAAAKGFRLLQVPWTGVDALDLPLLRRHQVTVCNSHSNAPTVAEFALALLLSTLKAIPWHDRRLREGHWLRPSPDGGEGEFHPPRALAGRRVGFIGYGAVARALARLLRGFEVRMSAVAARRRAAIPRPLSSLRPPSGLARLLSESDAVFVLCPLTPSTRLMLDGAMLARLKPGSVLVNVSRAELVDEAALYAALREGRLGGAAIDAWPRQPTPESPVLLPSTLPFHELRNVVLSPHRAGFASGELPHLQDAALNINRLAAGRPLINRVDLEKGY